MPDQPTDLDRRVSRPDPRGGWMAWAALAVVAVLAVGAVVVSVVLHEHAAERRRVLGQFAQIETQATAQAGLVWRAMTFLMAEEQMSFVRLRGEEQQRRGEILEQLSTLRALEAEGARINRWLGFETDAALLDHLDATAATFLGGVQGTISQMSLSHERVRERLRYWDMNIGAFREALEAVKTRDAEIAVASTNAANRATGGAALITLLASTLFAWQWSRVRSARRRDRLAMEALLRHQAMHDPLTDLPNRRQFTETFAALDAGARDQAAVLFIDLDGFKLVNDSYGHQTGDRLLVNVAARIRSCLEPADVLARQGGDEFIALVRGDTGTIVAAIAAVMAKPFVLDDREIFVSASIGVLSETLGLGADEAVQRADIAMYRAKQAGKSQAVVFRETMLDDAPERLMLEADLRRALERGEFTVWYQPKVSLTRGVTESLEALVRWVHPTRGIVGPDVFIPFAEEIGLISELGRIVLEQACCDGVRWQDRGVVVAVNLSPIQFHNPSLVDEVKHALEQSGLTPACLELEITESAVLGDLSRTVQVLDELKALGVRLAIDDFGTGYSNLAHLKHFNVDVLKIDQAFVRGGNPGSLDELSDGAIVEAVIAMAKAFGMHVVAEGVETESHADALRELGADLGQGYYFSKPVEAEAIDAFLAAEPARTHAA